DGYSGIGFFGLQVSTWEFRPATILVDYYNVVSLADHDVYNDFDSACPEWQVREHTGDDGGPPGSDWFSAECQDGNLEIQVDDRWEHVTVSPLVASPERSFEIQTRIYFQDRMWSHGYALVFGIMEPEVIQYYRVNVSYLSDGHMMYQVRRCESDHCSTSETLTLGVPGADDSGYIEVDKAILNGQEWNDWRIQRMGDLIRIYANDNLLLDISDDGYSGIGFFGLQVSTWEFRPATILVDYYNVVSLADHDVY
ncbi:MAG: hypothetical protein GY832_13820, partial [Chloroflexi bacterium]|nr:hypothetical protein [Chloroflexota bacterium]